jgi:hypothetical protein
VTLCLDIASKKEVENSTIGKKSDDDKYLAAIETVLEHYQERGTTLKSRVHYSGLLINRIIFTLESHLEKSGCPGDNTIILHPRPSIISS